MRELGPIGQLLQQGVSEFVVCGGARNAPLVESISRAAEEHPEIKIWQQFDERSAGFFALGRVNATGLPAAVVVTSGTAAAELLPAVVEAFYQKRPLILVTADRPESFRGTGAPQAIEQEGIYGTYAESGAWESWSRFGPFHLNLSLEEDAAPETAFPDLAAFMAPSSRLVIQGLAPFLIEDIYRGLVVIVGGLEPEEREAVYHFCKDLDVPLLVDPGSGLRELLDDQVLVDGDAFLAKNPPGKVLRLGDVPLGRFWRDLENLTEVEVLSVTRTGFAGLARPSQTVTGSVGRVLSSMGQVEPIGDVLDLLKKNAGARFQVDDLLQAFPESEPGMIHTLSVIATLGDSVFLGNSMPIREWSDYAQRTVPYDQIRAMRGANGIDGQISYWLAATADEEKSWAVLGDLTALYDVQGLAMSQQTGGQRILAVVNNGGGQIFNRLPRLASFSKGAQDAIVQAQEVDLSALAKLWKLNYVLISSSDGFDALDELPDGTTVVELRPDQSETEAFWTQLKVMREKRK